MTSFFVKYIFEKIHASLMKPFIFCHANLSVFTFIFCFYFYTAFKLCHVTFNESCTKFIVNIIIVNDNDINTKRLIRFVKSCHFTSVVYTVVLLYQSRRRISRVNINQFCSVWR